MVDDKFILMGLDDEKAGSIAEILKSQTAKKILDFLGDIKEASEKDISDKLNMPINTVEYNLKKLVNSGLVDKSKNFFWSVKGKKISMYKLAKKHIIIGTKKPDVNYLRSILPVVLIAAALVLIGFLVLFPDGQTSSDGKLKQFKTYSELENFLKENSGEANYYGGVFDGGILMERADSISPSTAGAEAKSADESVQSASEYSGTNIQAEGVDEADIVKNDGKYIYIVSNNKIVIVDAYPAENMNVLSEIEIKGGVSEIYINNDRLIVFGSSYGIYYAEAGVKSSDSVEGNADAGSSGAEADAGIAESSAAESADAKIAAPECLGCNRGYSNSIYIYDISDRKNPVLKNTIDGDGYYQDSRMIGDYVYVVSTKYTDLGSPQIPVYYIDGIKEDIGLSDVYYWDYPYSSYVFTSIMALNVKDENFENKIFLTGGSGTIYVSENNIYLTNQKFINYEEYLSDYTESVAYEILPDKKINEVKEITESDKKDYEKLGEIQNIIFEYSMSLTGDEKAEFDEKLNDLSREFEISVQKKIEKTIIHKISVNKLDITYRGIGEVPGRVLNQFSMDEYNNYLRIAVTTGNSWQETSLNHAYVLNKDLEIVGSVEDLALGEQIYSARFLGDKLYLVTFRQTDPLFIIDLSNPSSPKVLGYLKITGFSNYLHPYDENTLIGIGMEADEQGRAQGIKIGLFDVSDFENPKEIDKYIVEGDYSYSEVQYEHKAFLFDRNRNLMVIPISYSYYRDNYDYENWQGAFVFDVDKTNLELRGKITHYDLNKTENYYWYPGVSRSLFMDDVLYTISGFKVKANDLSDLKNIKEIVYEKIQEPNIYRGVLDSSLGIAESAVKSF